MEVVEDDHALSPQYMVYLLYETAMLQSEQHMKQY